MVVKRLPDNEMYHHGIKGQKWGVRRYQNADGSLTEKGKLRYTVKERENSLKSISSMSDDDIKKALNRMNLEKQYRTATEESIRAGKEQLNKTLKTIGKVAVGTLAVAGSAYLVKQVLTNQRKAKNLAKTISNMSDADITKYTTRLSNEQKLMGLVKASKTNSNSLAGNVISGAAASVLTTAVAGAMAFTLRTAISGKYDADAAANYIAPSPKSRKK